MDRYNSNPPGLNEVMEMRFQRPEQGRGEQPRESPTQNDEGNIRDRTVVQIEEGSDNPSGTFSGRDLQSASGGQ